MQAHVTADSKRHRTGKSRFAAERGHRRRSAVLAAGVVATAAVTLALTAALDASSILPRLQGDQVPTRPFWLHSASIAGITAVVGFVAAAMPHRRVVVRVLCTLAAAANLTVPVLVVVGVPATPSIAVLHVLAAALLLALGGSTHISPTDARRSH